MVVTIDHVGKRVYRGRQTPQGEPWNRTSPPPQHFFQSMGPRICTLFPSTSFSPVSCVVEGCAPRWHFLRHPSWAVWWLSGFLNQSWSNMTLWLLVLWPSPVHSERCAFLHASRKRGACSPPDVAELQCLSSLSRGSRDGPASRRLWVLHCWCENSGKARTFEAQNWTHEVVPERLALVHFVYRCFKLPDLIDASVFHFSVCGEGPPSAIF